MAIPIIDNMISLTEYATLHGVTPDTIRQGVLVGRFPDAHKLGRNWVIPKDAPFIDRSETTKQTKEETRQ